MKIAVFCSANKNIDPDFFTLTEEMGKWMAENGHDLVFGGCNSGLMDCIGKAVKVNGGRTIGVVPTLVERGGRTFPDLDIEIPCDNLSDRKDLMLAQSDIFVALPGGIGTLDEIFTIAAAHTIGYHHKQSKKKVERFELLCQSGAPLMREETNFMKLSVFQV